MNIKTAIIILNSIDQVCKYKKAIRIPGKQNDMNLASTGKKILSEARAILIWCFMTMTFVDIGLSSLFAQTVDILVSLTSKQNYFAFQNLWICVLQVTDDFAWENEETRFLFGRISSQPCHHWQLDPGGILFKRFGWFFIVFPKKYIDTRFRLCML